MEPANLNIPKLESKEKQMSATKENLDEGTFRARADRYRLAFSKANLGMCLVDVHGNIFEVNEKMSAIFGYSPRELEAMTVNDLAVPEDTQLSIQFIDHAVAGSEEQKIFEKRYLHKNGHIVHAQVASSLVRGSNGEPLYFISQVQDISERKQAEDKLRISEERHRLLADSARDVIWTMEADGSISYVSPSVELVRGFTPEEAMRQPMEEILTPDSLAAAQDYISRLNAAIEAGQPLESYRGDQEYYCKDGSTFWTEVIASPLLNADGRLIQIVGVTRDIAERKRLQKELEQQARIDYLTKLNNRGYFMLLAEQELARAIRYGSNLSLFMLDIDNFKKINDTHGHKSGDIVLQRLAEICRNTLREVDVIGRIGGEEFAILLPETDKSEAYAAAGRLRTNIAKTEVKVLSDLSLCFTVSIGISALSANGENIDLLLHMADKALYEAKNSGRNKVAVFRE